MEPQSKRHHWLWVGTELSSSLKSVTDWLCYVGKINTLSLSPHICKLGTMPLYPHKFAVRTGRKPMKCQTCDINFLFFLPPVLKQRTAVIIHSEVSNLNSSFYVLQDLKQVSDNFPKLILVFLKTKF